MAVSFHAKGSAPLRDHHACCDITFLHAKGNYYQSIKSNKKLFSSRGYDFPSCKTTEHDYLPRCGGGRSLRWRSRRRLTGGGRSLASSSKRTISPSPRVVQELARGQSRGVDCAQAGHFADRCWFLLLFAGTGIHDAAGGEYVISRPSRAPCRTPRSSTLPTGWWRSLKSVIVSVQTSVKIQSTLIIFFSYFCMVLNLPLYHGEPLSRMMLGTMMRKKMMGFIHRWYFLSNLCLTRLSRVILYLRIVS